MLGATLVILALIAAAWYVAKVGTVFTLLFIGGVGVILYFRDRGWHVGGALVAAVAFAFGGSAAAEGLGGDVTTESYIWTHTGVSLELAGVYGKVYPEDELN